MKTKFAGINFLAVLIAVGIMTPFVISNIEYLKNTDASIAFENDLESIEDNNETEESASAVYDLKNDLESGEDNNETDISATNIYETEKNSVSAEMILNNVIMSEFRKTVENERDLICYYISPCAEKHNPYPQLITVSKNNSDYGNALSEMYSKVTVYEWDQNSQIVRYNVRRYLIEPVFYYNTEEKKLFVAYGSEYNPVKRIVARMQYSSFYEVQDIDESSDSLEALTPYTDLTIINQAYNEALTNNYQ